MEARTALQYLRDELSLTMSDLKELSTDDRATLRECALVEMRVLGVPIKES